MEVLIMIAIINIPFRATIEPNIFVGEDEVDTFDITHELIPGTQLFRVNIKHIIRVSEIIILHQTEVSQSYGQGSL